MPLPVFSHFVLNILPMFGTLFAMFHSPLNTILPQFSIGLRTNGCPLQFFSSGANGVITTDHWIGITPARPIVTPFDRFIRLCLESPVSSGRVRNLNASFLLTPSRIFIFSGAGLWLDSPGLPDGGFFFFLSRAGFGRFPQEGKIVLQFIEAFDREWRPITVAYRSFWSTAGCPAPSLRPLCCSFWLSVSVNRRAPWVWSP
jgi:hypothetical protein